jgi:DNA invertase Pin-like site-specific DNA recombinase
VENRSLARSLNHLAQLLAEFQNHKVALVCPSQGIDTTASNPCAEFQINIFAAVAQFERELIIERVRAGIVAAKQRGTRLGRPRKNDRHFDHVRELIADGRNAADRTPLKIPFQRDGNSSKVRRLNCNSNRRRRYRKP